MAEFALDVENERDEALEVLLVCLEVLAAHDGDHAVGQLVELQEEYLVGAVHDDLGQSTDGTLLHSLVPILLDDFNGEHFEVALERGQLLFLVLDTRQDVPLKLTNGLANTSRYLLLRFIAQFFAKVAEYFGQERHEGFLEDLGSHAKLRNLLLHLVKIHVLVEFTQLRQKMGHALVICDVVRHNFLELLSSLLRRVRLGKLLERFKQALLELLQADAGYAENGLSRVHGRTLVGSLARGHADRLLEADARAQAGRGGIVVRVAHVLRRELQAADMM